MAHRKRLRIGVASVVALLAMTPAFASETQSYSYDELGRVVKVVHSGSVNNWLSSCYAYDKADNRSNITVLTNGDCAAPLPSFSINSASATEGSAVVFTVTKTGTSYGPLTVNYASTGGTATSGTDFTATSGALSFLASDVTKTISVATTDDTAAGSGFPWSHGDWYDHDARRDRRQLHARRNWHLAIGRNQFVASETPSLRNCGGRNSEDWESG